MTNAAIRFYGASNPYGWLSNFSPHAIRMDDTLWPTVEHYFQAQKFSERGHRLWVLSAGTPTEAKKRGRTTTIDIDEWKGKRVEVMRRAILAKFKQNRDLAMRLGLTGVRPLIEAAPQDSFWGEGKDGKGKNQLGLLLMEARATLDETSPLFS